MVEDAGRGWRKVVPSPKPIDVVPKWIIRDLVQAGRIVIAAGGGGIPVILNGNGLYEGVEAVIDKDYAASLIAREIGVDLFIILTAIDRVYVDFGKPTQRELPGPARRRGRAPAGRRPVPAGLDGAENPGGHRIHRSRRQGSPDHRRRPSQGRPPRPVGNAHRQGRADSRRSRP